MLSARLPDVLGLNRRRVHERARHRFDYRRMVDGYEHVYRQLVTDFVAHSTSRQLA